MRHKPGTKQSQGEKSVKDIRHATFEWPEFSPPRWDNDDASAAEFALRARAAQISDDLCGWLLHCKRFFAISAVILSVLSSVR
ncbi:hypothetical protein, partial [uncultured Ruegeria sp.]|uniref:hypothetical protein n=1 Tax=uncultured Ruegeria sp. TaxID=259304 RepID=UPI002622B3BA